jgi:glycosyltransferase involved in cell wall biosynthesis
VSKEPSLSIIIPVYNEENHIRRCLKAIAAQTVPPDEVIVVDNNSTDKTVEIAKSFPFVRIVHEKKQGRVFARTCGFNASHCTILGRIDADSVIDTDWVDRVRAHFAEKNIGGVTGLGKTVTLPRIRWLHTTLWARDYYWGARVLFGIQVLWGANMAVSRVAWDSVKDRICLDDSITHEDTDLSLLIASEGFRLLRDNRLLITSNGQSYHYWPKLFEYTRRCFSTKAYHKKRGTYEHIAVSPGPFGRASLGLAVIVFNIPFFVVSLLLWPFDRLVMSFFSSERRWLD